MPRRTKESARIVQAPPKHDPLRQSYSASSVEDLVQQVEKCQSVYKAAVKRSLKKTRREIRFAHYSILCAMIAIEQENKYIFGMFAVLAVCFLFNSPDLNDDIAIHKASRRVAELVERDECDASEVKIPCNDK
jgi:hypothetical protein